MSERTILLIDHVSPERDVLARDLESFGFFVQCAEDLENVNHFLDHLRPHLVILDEHFQYLAPDDALREIQVRDLDTFVILISRQPNLNRSMSWISSGVFAYLERPIQLETLREIIQNGFENQSSYHEVVALAQDLKAANQALEKEKAALNERTRELRFLYDFSMDLSRTLNAREVMQTATQAFQVLLKPDLLTFLMAIDGGADLRIYTDRRITAGLGDSLAAGLLAEYDQELAVKVSTYTLIEPLDERTPLIRTPRHRQFLPLTVAGHPCGMMGLYFSKRTAIDPERRMILEGVALQTAQALENAQRHEIALKLAANDPLTGLFNRRAFDENLEREFRRYKRYGTNLTLLLIDLDYFKSINDTYGHGVGDEVLRMVSRVIRKCVRATDISARIGGEEFAVIMPDTDQFEAMSLARRIQGCLEDSIVYNNNVEIRQKVSQGLADARNPMMDDAVELVRLADQAMYLAKSDGRNTIRTAADLILNIEEGSYYACRH